MIKQIDYSIESPIKMNEMLRFKKGMSLSGNNIPSSLGGFWMIQERRDISNKGGRAKLIRIMTSNTETEPLGESFFAWYGMICSCMEQVEIKNKHM